MPRYGSADDRRSWSQCAIAFREGFDTQLTAAVISTVFLNSLDRQPLVRRPRDVLRRAPRASAVTDCLAESHLTPKLFRQILARIERFAWHPTVHRADTGSWIIRRLRCLRGRQSLAATLRNMQGQRRWR